MKCDRGITESGLSRRSFLLGVGASVAGVAAAGALGCAPSASKDASEDKVDDALIDEVGTIEPVAAPNSWDKEADVIIVGAGGGIFGALRAVELGYSVMVVEKTGGIGGASKNASAWGPVSGTKCQMDAGYPDLSETFLEAFKTQFGSSSNWQEFAVEYDKAQRAVVDLISRNGCEWQPSTVLGPEGGSFAIAPKGSEEGGMTALAIKYPIESSAKAVEAGGGEILLNTTMKALVMEDGAVLGIQVADSDGNLCHYKANKGVVVATGGMTSNKEMLKEYCPTPYKYARFCTTGPQDTGEGIRMLLGADGLFSGYDCHCIFDGGLKGTDWSYYMYNASVQVARQPWLGINKFGDRYPYYTSGGAYCAQAQILMNQPGGEGYVFFDSNYEKYAESWQAETQMCRRLIEPDMPDVDRINNLADKDWRDGMATAIEQELILKADTIEELAGKLGINPDVANKAVKHWNELCVAGQDSDGIYADNPEFLKPIDTPPYYGTAIGGFLIATTAGVTVDKHSQVLSASTAAPIPGLYAAGCTIGRGDNGSWSCFSAATAYMAVSSM